MAALLVLVLLTRLLVPAGFMPAAQSGPAVVLCTGGGMIVGWIDADGTVHEKQDEQKSATDAPCAFAGVGASLDGVSPAIMRAVGSIGPALPLATITAVTIGRGLAAPPPPQTGPPPQP
ncbi:MAG: hypothetical protein KKD64_06080 [Alphaproteobacteria bacterium]|nr:hypothetical protein [Alphaproteobacteria bacterium]MBU0795073.1 hypothetical protein [Alphaproteobacteria bacterium]MBU0875004.1 hypothetical protein [Alphaproteobacteria bacterium]MBU1769206.1 hypothetical protein [Alphaproteobacteria bacterium]